MADLYSARRKKKISKKTSTYWRQLMKEVHKKQRTQESANECWNQYVTNFYSTLKSVHYEYTNDTSRSDSDVE
jgi:histone H3/H4